MNISIFQLWAILSIVFIGKFFVSEDKRRVLENMADLMKEIYHETISSHDAKMLYIQYMDEYELLSEKEKFL